jgi:myosin heavy subunit
MNNIQKRRPNSGSIKNAGNNIINRNTESRNTILVRDTVNKQQGNGLWCVNTDRNLNNLKKENLEKNKSEAKTNKNQNLNTEIISEFDRKIIENLKFKNKDVTEKLQKALAKAAEMEYKAQRYENTMQNYVELCEEKATENKEIKERFESLENNSININEALSNARKEINRLQIELNSEAAKSKGILEMYQNLLLDKDRREAMVNSEINNLMLKIQSVQMEKENLLKLMKNQDKSFDYASGIQKLMDQKETLVRNNEIQMTKILMENAELKKRIGNEENNKIKSNEIIKKKKEKINNLKEQLKSYKDAVLSSKNETKWNNDLVLQRDIQIKVLKEKLKKNEEEFLKLNKTVEVLKKKKDDKGYNCNQVNNENFEMQQVPARPFLFGPEKSDFDC